MLRELVSKRLMREETRGTGHAASALLLSPEEKLKHCLLATTKVRDDCRRTLDEVEGKTEETFYRDKLGQHNCRIVLLQPCRQLSKLLMDVAALEAAAVVVQQRAAEDVAVAKDRVGVLESELRVIYLALVDDLRRTELEAHDRIKCLTEALAVESEGSAREAEALQALLVHAEKRVLDEQAQRQQVEQMVQQQAQADADKVDVVLTLRREIDRLQTAHAEQLKEKEAKHVAEVTALRKTIAIREQDIVRQEHIVKVIEKDAASTSRIMNEKLVALEAVREHEAAVERAERIVLEQEQEQCRESATKAKLREKQRVAAELQRAERELIAQEQRHSSQLSQTQAQRGKETAAMRKELATMQRMQRLALGIADDAPSLEVVTASLSHQPARMVAHSRSAPALRKPGGTTHQAGGTHRPSPQKQGSQVDAGSEERGAIMRGRQWVYWQTLKSRMDNVNTVGCGSEKVATIKATAASEAKNVSPRPMQINRKGSATLGAFRYPTGLSAAQATTLHKPAAAQVDWLPLRSAREIAPPG